MNKQILELIDAMEDLSNLEEAYLEDGEVL